MSDFVRSEKLSVDKVNLSEQEPGFSFQGKFIDEYEGEEFLDKRRNEKRRLTFHVFEYVEGTPFGKGKQGRFQYIADKGIQSALQESRVKVGAIVEVVKKEPIDLDDNRQMNQYDVFALTSKG